MNFVLGYAAIGLVVMSVTRVVQYRTLSPHGARDELAVLVAVGLFAFWPLALIMGVLSLAWLLFDTAIRWIAQPKPATKRKLVEDPKAGYRDQGKTR